MTLRFHDGPDYRAHENYIGGLAPTHAHDGMKVDGKIGTSELRSLRVDMAGVKCRYPVPSVGHCGNVGVSLKK